jgi:RsiW-degrading membrane proteinase PrsW (M82 family)
MNAVDLVVLLLILLVAFSAARLILWAWWIRKRNVRMERYDERWLRK